MCYDIPPEFRVTSRSPRSPREAPASPVSYSSPVDEAEQNLHQAVYEHATEDWYRVKRDVEGTKKEYSSDWFDDGDGEEFDEDEGLLE